MVYKLITYNLEDDGERIFDEFDLTDNNGRVLHFPSEETAVSFAEKYKSDFLYDGYADYEIIVDSENWTYTEEEAKILIEFLLDM